MRGGQGARQEVRVCPWVLHPPRLREVSAFYGDNKGTQPFLPCCTPLGFVKRPLIMVTTKSTQPFLPCSTGGAAPPPPAPPGLTALGPLPKAMLASLFHEGRVGPDTPVWALGQGTAGGSLPAPLASLRELRWGFWYSGVHRCLSQCMRV